MKVCVVGAGVLGLTIAYELSGRGHDVVIMEKEAPFAGASHRSFAWINANNKQPSEYHRLNALGVEEHVRFQEEFPSNAVWLSMCGNILADFSEDRSETYKYRIDQAHKYGSEAQEISRADLMKREPSVDWPEDLDSALFFPREGYLDNDVLARELLDVLSARDVAIRHTSVESVESTADYAAVQSDEGVERFDRVVIAAGAGSRGLAENSGFQIPVADLSVPSSRTHSLLGLSRPTDLNLNHVVITNRINVRPRHDGRMWVQVPYVEHRVEEGESAGLLQEIRLVMEAEVERLFGVRVAIDEVIYSGRSFPEDGMSIMGYVDTEQRIYCAVTHSGMTLAPLFADLASDELDGGSSPLLEVFRPSRFSSGTKHVYEQGFIGKQ